MKARTLKKIAKEEYVLRAGEIIYYYIIYLGHVGE